MKTKLIYALLIIVITFVGYTLFLPRLRPTPISINEISATGTVILAFSPPTLAITPSSTFAIPLTINTGTAKVTAVGVEVTFDPAKLQLISVTPGTFLTNILAAPVITLGKVTFTYSVPVSNTTGNTGTSTLATLNFKALSLLGPTNLSFGNNTLAAATGIAGNVLKTANPLTLSIVNPSPTPSTNPSATPTPTPTPSPQPSGFRIADLNRDTKIDIFDYNLFVQNYGKTGAPGFTSCDVNSDGKVSIIDYNLIIADWVASKK